MLKIMKKVFLFLFGLTITIRCDDRIIAWVEDEVITQKELEESDKNLEEMINNIIFQKAASKLGINIPESMVLERIEEIKGGFPSYIKFQEALQRQGIQEEELKTRIKNELLRARFINLLKGRIKIKEDELFSSVDKWEEEVNVDFFEMKNEDDANKAFLELTKTGTTSHEIKNTGFFCFSEMREEFSNVAFSLDEGKISHPFKMDGKFYIIKRGEKRETSSEHLAKIRDELFMENKGRVREKTKGETRDDIFAEILSLTQERLKNQRFEEYLLQYINEIRKEAYVLVLSF